MKHLKTISEAWDDGYYDPPDSGPDYEPERDRELPENKIMFKVIGMVHGYALVWQKPDKKNLWLVDLDELEEQFEEGGYLYKTPTGRDWDGDTIWEYDHTIYEEMIEDLVTDLWTGGNPDLKPSGPNVRALNFGEGLEDSFFAEENNSVPVVKLDQELAEKVIDDLVGKRSELRRPPLTSNVQWSNTKSKETYSRMLNAIGRAFPPAD